MFSPHLYDHKFDIDDLIAAMLKDEGSYLETVTGTLSTTPPNADSKHTFYLKPLPTNWLASLPEHDDHERLLPAEAAELSALIKTPQPLHDIIFGPTQLGGWLRERAKEEALQWLADNNLVPPSMRHINGVPRARPKAVAEQGPFAAKKVTIEPA